MVRSPNCGQFLGNFSRKCFIWAKSRGHNERCAAARKPLCVTCTLQIIPGKNDLRLCDYSLFPITPIFWWIFLQFWCWWQQKNLFIELYHVIISVYPWKLAKNKFTGWTRTQSNCKHYDTATEGVACNLTWRCFATSIQRHIIVGRNINVTWVSTHISKPLFLHQYHLWRRHSID